MGVINEGFNHGKIKEWTYFFDKIGLIKRHGLTKKKVEDDIKKCDYSLFDQPLLSKLLREARDICSEVPENIKFPTHEWRNHLFSVKVIICNLCSIVMQ